MATTDVMSLDDARSIVRMNPSDTYHHGRLAGYVTAISHRFDEVFGPVVKRTITGERVDGGCDVVLLRRRPVAEITSVTTYSAGVATVLTAESLVAVGDYYAEPDRDDPTLLSGRLFARSGWMDSWWPAGRQNVVVDYVAGRFENTAAVKDTVWYQAAALTLKSLWRGEEDTIAVVNDYEQPQTAIPTFAIPNVAVELLAGERRMWGIA